MMYAIKFHGMYVRALDGGMTDNKQSVKLFDTIEMGPLNTLRLGHRPARCMETKRVLLLSKLKQN